MLATQNRPVLKMANVPAPERGHLRKWVDHIELRRLLAPHFLVEEMFSITPRFDRGILRILNSSKMRRLAKALRMHCITAHVNRKERAWLGWTLMALARKRAS